MRNINQTGIDLIKVFDSTSKIVLWTAVREYEKQYQAFQEFYRLAKEGEGQ